MLRSITFVVVAAFSLPAFAAQGDDPDWPCIQRKVPQLSIGQIWTGTELPPAATDWSNDARVSALVEELAARRLAVSEAQKNIGDLAKTLAEGEKQRQLTMLVQGLFDQMNRERSHVIEGIGRYANKQRQMAEALRQEASAVDALRAKPDADAKEFTVRQDRLMFETRVFQERVQSLSFVCEVPTLIEQRLYALVKSIAEALSEK